MEDLISVIIPTYKRGFNTLKTAVDSVLKQSYDFKEILIIDDNDNSEYMNDVNKIKNSYPHITIVSYEGNRGACFARNVGIKKAKGKFLAFLDDDDVWEYDKLEKQMKVMGSDQSVALVYCGISWFYENKNVHKQKLAIKHQNPWRELLIENYIGSTSCGLVRRSAAINVGMFDERLKSGQDLDFWIRLALEYKIDCVEECLVNYTLYNSNSITSNKMNRLDSNIYLKGKYKNFFYDDIELKTIYTLKILKSYIINRKLFTGFVFLIKSILNKEFSITYIQKYLFH